MSLWDRLFGVDHVVEKAADGIYHGLDKLKYTDEEKADANLEGQRLFLKFVEATAPWEIARRLIANQVTFVWTLFAIIVGIGGVFDFSYYDRMKGFMVEVVNGPFELVLWFYYLKRIVPDGMSAVGNIFGRMRERVSQKLGSADKS